MVSAIDNFLNQTTMYRLMLYYLIAIVITAIIFSALGILPFNPFGLLLSTIFLVIFCWLTNRLFARVFNVATNVESVYISALILALIVTPARTINDLSFLGWSAILATASKYILAWKKKHLFNPAAVGIFLPSIFLNQAASWWVGNLPMFLPVILGGILIVRKVQRGLMVTFFLAAAMLATLASSLGNTTEVLFILGKIFIYSPILFFAFVMLIEPQTTPPTKNLRLSYSSLVGFLFSLPIYLGPFSITPEAALLLGNVFSFLVSSKERLILTLEHKTKLSQNIYDFVFNPKGKFTFSPGQYLEWTLGHRNPDSRGNRRYFTIASAPSEDRIRIGVKFASRGSSFKQALQAMRLGDKITATQLSGDFTLPNDPKAKLAFVAGGIGITPFRSMLQYLLDKEERRDIILFYVAKTPDDFVYKEILASAKKKLGVKVTKTITDKLATASSWRGSVGRISAEMIKRNIPDYQERLFYLSGPHSLVDSIEKTLRSLALQRSQIKTDFFPGYV